MCGILAVFNTNLPLHVLQSYARKLRHRGPDASGHVKGPDYFIAHERLAIIDPVSGAQPFQNNGILAVNGEIYNHEPLRTGEELTGSDCEVILTNSGMGLKNLLKMLDGVYAFVLYQDGKVFAARDPVGVMPLYYGYGFDGSIAFASEMKALEGLVGVVKKFPPGHYYDGAISCFESLGACMMLNETVPCAIKPLLQDAVNKRTMSDVPWAVLLSGGLDSAIVAYLASLHHKPLQTFCIGLEGSQDCKAAQQVADHIGSKHTNFTFTVEEGWDAIQDVIYHLETFDVTTIRAGVPMYLLARRVRSMGIKMVLSGEGSDEIFGGYLYFHNAPDAMSFQQECFDKIKRLHLYDCLRANKAMAAFGVECRVPFLDRNFLKHSMQLPPAQRMPQNGVEKHLLRSQFEGCLPESILWRQKEQFSDGVGYKWIDFLKKKTYHYTELIGKGFFPMNPPKTGEAFYYRMLFEKMFKTPGAVKTVPYENSCACSTGVASKWKGNEVHDASGRSVLVHSINKSKASSNGKRTVNI